MREIQSRGRIDATWVNKWRKLVCVSTKEINIKAVLLSDECFFFFKQIPWSIKQNLSAAIYPRWAVTDNQQQKTISTAYARKSVLNGRTFCENWVSRSRKSKIFAWIICVNHMGWKRVFTKVYWGGKDVSARKLLPKNCVTFFLRHAARKLWKS